MTFICFEGLDGTGKSTIANNVTELLKKNESKILYLDKKNPNIESTYVNNHLKQIKKVLWNYHKDDPLYELGDYHWLHLNASWFAALDNCVIKPLLEKNYIIIMDNWYYKLYARYKLKENFDSKLLDSSFGQLTKPDITIFLDIEPEISVNRRDDFSITETGNMDGLTGKTKDNYLRYQSKVRNQLLNLSNSNNWNRFDFSDIEENESTEIIYEFLKRKFSND
ncbi:Thymidylate kinase [Mammaliicoccus sciuri]|uniref:dTMP kinase n=1 Tax=Mammaliicoccus sciuri TaxID=1296 RepID=UPI001EF64D31|nr:hypothetical protein [Mammaliicoccus sciuri]CAG7915104.1 Thymidylate kinase [Mammaliicoccus sciuri]